MRQDRAFQIHQDRGNPLSIHDTGWACCSATPARNTAPKRPLPARSPNVRPDDSECTWCMWEQARSGRQRGGAYEGVPWEQWLWGAHQLFQLRARSFLKHFIALPCLEKGERGWAVAPGGCACARACAIECVCAHKA